MKWKTNSDAQQNTLICKFEQQPKNNMWGVGKYIYEGDVRVMLLSYASVWNR